MRPKAVLKHTHSKRWRASLGGLANAERLDCVRFIAAFSLLDYRNGYQLRNSGSNLVTATDRLHIGLPLTLLKTDRPAESVQVMPGDTIGKNLTGGIGPSLVDAVWVHGGQPTQMLKVVNEGVLTKGMPAWGPILGPKKVSEVLAFILSHHTPPADVALAAK